jgi:hypothetical protein
MAGGGRASAKALTSAVIILAIAALNFIFAPVPEGAVRYGITAAVLAQVFPPLAVWLNGTGRDPARWWVAVWAVAYVISDFAQLLLALTSGQNLWFLTISQPVQDGLLLWALSLWQNRPVMRLTFRVAIPIHVLVTLGFAIAAGEQETFKTFASPFRSLVILSAAAYTIVSRSAEETDRIWMRDWLWTSLGVALYYGVYVIVEPVSGWLLAQGRSETVVNLYVVKAIFDVLAFLLIWKGMRCPLTPDFSASGSAQRWPSSSS